MQRDVHFLKCNNSFVCLFACLFIKRGYKYVKTPIVHFSLSYNALKGPQVNSTQTAAINSGSFLWLWLILRSTLTNVKTNWYQSTSHLLYGYKSKTLCHLAEMNFRFTP